MNTAQATDRGPTVTTSIILGLLMLVPLTLAGFGAWIGSSLALFLDGPVWLALIGSFVVFFVIPLIWELRADPDQRGGRIRDAILRSSVLSGIFVVVLVGFYPETTFKALATRGDWWLAGSQTPAAQSLRKLSFAVADGLEWLNDAVRDKPYREGDDSAGVDPGKTTEWPSATLGKTTPVGTRTTAPKPEDEQALPIPGIAIPGSELRWPLEATVHPIVAEIPDEAKTSPEAVGKWLKGQITDPFELAKAVHDFVAMHVTYDFEKVRTDTNNATNQAAAVVLKTGMGVCAGYAELTAAVGTAAGLNVIYVVGDSRNTQDYQEIASENLSFPEDAGHAWNAVEINGRWYLMDVTWDSGHGSIAEGFTRRYRTTYLFIPPEAMLINHLPDAKKWQLVEAPLTRADWLRTPLVDPISVAYGVAFADHPRPVVGRSDPLIVAVENPLGFHLSVSMAPPNSDARARTECDAQTNARKPKFICPPLSERFHVLLWARPTKYGDATLMGSYWVDD